MKVYQVLIYETIGEEFQNVIFSDGVLKNEIEEIKSRFKNTKSSSYSYFKLRSLRYSFVRTTCKEGKNIIHGLIIEGEINFYPYEIIDSSSFISMTGIECLGELDYIELNKEINENTIIEFIKLKDPKIIRDMINAVIDFKLSRRSICIVDSKENFINFLGAIQRAFPIRLSRNITFTTCEDFNNDEEFIIHFSRESSNYENRYTFDLLREIKAVIEREYKYSELIEIGYYTSYQNLKNFHRFFQEFSYEVLDGELDFSYILFSLLNINVIPMQREDINGALKFLIKYCDRSNLQGIFERYYRIFSDLVPRLDEKGSLLLSEIIFRAASSSNNVPSYEVAVRIFFSIIDHLVIDIKLDNINELFNKHFDNNKGSNIFLKYSLSVDRIKFILKILSENNMEKRILFYNYAIIESACELGYSWSQVVGIEGMEILLDLSSRYIIESKNDIYEIIDSASKYRDILIHIVLLLYNRASNNSQLNFIIERFIDILDKQDEKTSIDIRREIYRLSGGKILIRELTKRLETSMDKIGLFKEYLAKVFYSIPDYYNKYFTEAVKNHMYLLDLEDAYKESLFFIDLIEEGSVVFDRDTLSGVIKAFEKGIDLGDINSIKDKVIKVKRIKRKCNIETHPDIVSLLNFIYDFDDDRGDVKIPDVLEDLKINIDGLSGKKHEKYLSLCIPKIIEYVKSKDDHKIIVGYLFSSNNEVEFINNYIYMIDNLLDKDSKTGYEVFMYFIVYYLFYLEGNYRLLGENEIIEKIEERMLWIIAKRDREFMLKLDRDIRKEFDENGYSIPVKWGQMFSRSMENKSFRNRLKNIFKK